MKLQFSNIKGCKILDYISGWFMKAARFISDMKIAQYSFVSTNSLVQGEQVSILWPIINKYNVVINAAYKDFIWSNNAKNSAAVYVVIIQLSTKESEKKNKPLYYGESKKYVQNISNYLTPGKNVIVYKSRKPISDLPEIAFGSMPNDGGGLIFSKNEYEKAIVQYPILTKYFKKFIGAQEFINGYTRYTLWLNQSTYQNIMNNPVVKNRIEITRKHRLNSKAKATRQLADIPYRFSSVHEPTSSTIIVPSAFSGNRIYIPAGIVGRDTVISNLAYAIYNAPIWVLGLIESKLHIIWLSAVGGRLKKDYRYSAGLVYNTFPVPKISTRRKNEIEQLTLNILDIREEEGGTLADLYGSPLAKKNPKPMNPRLLKAHQELDEVVDRAYKSSGFKDDNDRLALLLDMYSERVKQLNEK